MNRAIIPGPGTVLRLLTVLLIVTMPGSVFMSQARASDFAARADVDAFIERMVAKHGFDSAYLQGVFAQARRRQSILDAISRPAERRLTWAEYRNIFVKPQRIREGVEFWRANAATLARAEAEYGVPASVIVAIIGVETRFGRIKGSYRVLDALSTLAFDYPPRSTFFTGELEQFLLLAREEQREITTLTGSYAGAMGYGQFIPSSYRAYAVDFDGDDARDIWDNEVDAIGSVANYFHRHGWQAGGTAMVPVAEVNGAAAALANKKLALDWTVGELRAAGVRPAVAIDDAAPAFLVRLQGVDGAEHWLALNNFYVVTRYNRSRLYAKAVLDLADEIRRAAPAALLSIAGRG